jgi:hypothetical protein
MTSGFAHMCAYIPNSAFCLGNNDFGQSTVPLDLTMAGNPGTLSAGGYHTCAIDSVLGLRCWGDDLDGQIDVPTTLKNPRQVSAGLSHTCALDDNGVTCWGRSEEGQIAVPSLKNPSVVQAGGYHTCAVDDDGLKCWGNNDFGQAIVPTTLSNKIANLTLGLFHTCAASK